jgi:hypothetical protein
LLASLHVARCIIFCLFDPQSRWFTGAWQTKLRQAIRRGKGVAQAGTTRVRDGRDTRRKHRPRSGSGIRWRCPRWPEKLAEPSPEVRRNASCR